LPALVLPGAAWAAQPKQAVTDIDQKAFFKPELYISSAHVAVADIQSRLPNQEAWSAFLQARAAGGRPVQAYVDPRSGAATNIIGAFPLIPGGGDGNAVTLASVSQALGRSVEAVNAEVVAALVRRFAVAHQGVLGIDVRQLGPATASQVTPDLWQVSIPQQVRGVPVRYGRLAATISHGNLVLIGTETWGNARVDAGAEVVAEHALDAGFAQAGGRTVADVMLQDPTLEIVPVAPLARQQGDTYTGEVGAGYEHRLVWSFVFQRQPEGARWEVLVDAHTAEVLSLQDVNHYVQRRITGGAYPLTSTEICPNPDQCGVMQTGSPMPFANTGLAAPNNFTNSAGVFDWTSGNVTTTFNGRYVRMADSCGAASATAAGDVLLGGTNGQHDCTTPGTGGAGNTSASRSGFYELNKLAEQARGWLPGNAWLQNQITANMNLTQTCNAFWNGSTVNFYRSGGGCRNTGELAAVFDHEWGHGLDDNDAAGALSSSSEAYADIAAIYRLEASCVGHGFFWTLSSGCGQTADGTGFNTNEALTGAAYCATDCSGVRDTDYAKHNPPTPATALGFVCGQCTTGPGPCGRQVHCSAAPVRQAAWDLVARDLVVAPFSYDSQSAFIVGNKVFYQGSGNIGAWHACTCGSSSSGCGATNGYMQWLTADDDNGNLNDGTPHMTAIFAAYNRHGVACATPTAVNSGCAAGPGGPVSGLTATPGNYQVGLTWNAATGATRYWVFRSEGHAGCDFGKALIAEVTTTSYTDTQVANGRQYYYNVVPAGASSACYGRAGTCVPVTPNGTPTPDFSVSCSPSSVSIVQGSSGSTTCTVTAIDGFSSAVNLSCANLPSGVTCTYNPPSVTPTANSSLTINVPSGAPTGSFTIQAQGTSGALTRSANIGLTITPAPVPNFTVSCSPASLTVTQGQTSGASDCTVTSTNGFNSAVNLSCTGMPAGSTCNFNPVAVTPPANGSVTSTLSVTAAGNAATGSFNFTVQGVSGALTRTFGMGLTVNGTGGGGDLTATFDAARQAPACNTVGRSCDTGTLVQGRANLGPETNQPNTINDSCADGTSGVFHSDESNDRIKVTSVDGTNFAAGKTVRIEATVWAWTTPSTDTADFYFTSNAASPSWTLIGSVVPSVVGAQTLSATYTLPAGALQAVRVQFRYQSTNANCAAGGFNDRDDLVFAVTSAPVNTVFFDDFETAQGWVTNPNGTDNATTGMWERGNPADTNSAGIKQLGTTVSGVNDLVTGAAAGIGAGDFDIDSGTTSIQSPVINLPPTGTLTLSFSYYLAHGSNSSSADFFRVRVVGTTTTTVLNVPGAAVNRNGAWATFSGNISAHAGQAVRILIDAADASTASLVEAGVDDVRITQQ
jgi:hypothetical protein